MSAPTTKIPAFSSFQLVPKLTVCAIFLVGLSGAVEPSCYWDPPHGRNFTDIWYANCPLAFLSPYGARNRGCIEEVGTLIGSPLRGKRVNELWSFFLDSVLLHEAIIDSAMVNG